MRKTRGTITVATLVCALTVLGATAASAASRTGTLQCTGTYYPNPTVRSITTGYVIHDWENITTNEFKEYGFPLDGAHSSSGWHGDANQWFVDAAAISYASGTCA